MLEAAQYEDNCFLTLTYDEKNLPEDQSVNPREIQLFIKKLRFHYPRKIRYFAVGEYGDGTMRAHYHIALFNFPQCKRGISRFNTQTGKCCATCDLIKTTWGKGQVIIGTLEPASAAYVAGYVVKKMTKDDDPRLEGRRPEFARMSLRPAIGVGMMHELASTLMEHKLDEKMIDVPLTLQHGKAHLPLGRFLRRKLREFIGRNANTPQEVLDAQTSELHEVRKAAFDNSRSFKAELLKTFKGRHLQIEAREKLKRKKTL